MGMKDRNLDGKNDDMCEVFSAHEDTVNRVKERMPSDEEYLDLSEFFKIFSNPTRLKIISLLTVDDLCVCDICEALDLNQTTVSNQLRILRANNIVKYQKEGKLARYSLTDLHIEMIYKVGLEHILE
jgi:DNA-binding transcriptional ArsR family regulator